MLPLHVTLVKVKWFLVSRVQLLSDKSELEDTQSASSMSPSVGLFDDGSPPPPEAHRLSALAGAGSGKVSQLDTASTYCPLCWTGPPPLLCLIGAHGDGPPVYEPPSTSTNVCDDDVIDYQICY